MVKVAKVKNVKNHFVVAILKTYKSVYILPRVTNPV